MKSVCSIYLLLSFFVIGPSVLFSQTGSVVITSPSSIETCSGNTFTALIDPGSGISTGSFSVTFDPDAQFTDLNNVGFVVSGNTASLSLTNQNAPLSVDYELYFPCEMIEPEADGNGVLVPKLVTDTCVLDDNSGSPTTLFHDYLLGYPNLISSTNASLTAQSHMGATVVRDLIVENTGTINYTGALTFTDNLACTSVSIESITITVENSGGVIQGPISVTNTNYIELVDGWLDLPSDNGATFIRIREELLITDCLDDDGVNNCINNTALSEFDVTWGCDLTDQCKLIDQYTATITRDNAAPNIQVYRMEPSGTDPFEDLCMNDPQNLNNVQPSMYTKRKYAYVNEGDFTAFHVFIRVAEEVGNIVGNDFKNDMIFDQNISVYDQNGVVVPPTSTSYALAGTQVETSCYEEAINNGFQPISAIAWKVPEIAPGDTVFLDYDVFRCCPQDTFYYNEPTYFDTWGISGTNGSLNPGGLFSDECSTYDAAFDAPNYGSDKPQEGLYYFPYPKSRVLNMTHQNLTTVSNMTGGADATCNLNGKQVFELLTTSFNSPVIDDGILQLFSTGAGGNLDGTLRVNLTLDQGLQYMAGDVLELVNYTSSAPVSAWAPVTINGPVVLNPTQTQYSLEFDLSDFNTSMILEDDYEDLRDFLLNSIFRFELTPCCPAVGPKASFTVDWDLNVSGANCYDCWLPLSRVSRAINILCPGCVTPGIIVDNLTLERTNFGWKDVDNNGLEDSPQDKIDDVNELVIQSNRFRGMPGDTVHAEVSSYFQEGDNTNGGFDYDCWLDHWGPQGDTLSYLYVNVVSPCINPGSFNWQLITDSMRVYSAQTGMWSSWFDIAGLAVSAGDQVFHKISMSDVRAAGAIHDTVFFDEGDQYEYKMDFRICGNADTAAHITGCEVTVQSWIAGADMGTNAFSTIPSAGDVNDTLTGNCDDRVAAVSPNMIYYCEFFSRQFDVVRFYTNITSSWSHKAHDHPSYWNVPSCRKSLSAVLELRTGGAMSTSLPTNLFNYFPYEYRPIDPSLISLDFPIPNGYYVSGVENWTKIPVYLSGSTLLPRSIRHTPNTGTVNTSLTQGTFTPNPSAYVHASENYSINQTQINYTTPYNFSELLIGDEKLYQGIKIFYMPDDNCAPELDTVSLAGLQVTTNYSMNICSSPALTEVDTPAGVTEFVKPVSNLNLGQTGNVSIETEEVCFNLTLTNTPMQGGMDNSYILVDFPPELTINSFVNAANGMSLPVSSFGLVELGDIAWQTNNFEICFSLTDCSNLDPISLPIRYGYDCTDYPTSANDIGCWEDTIYVNIVPEAIGLSNDSIAQDMTMDPCGTAHFEACTSPTENGDIDDLGFSITLPLGAQIVPGSMTVNYSGANGSNVPPTLVSNTGNVLTYALDTNWALIDISESLCISFDYEFSSWCDPNIGQPPSVTITGVAYCGDAISTNLQFDPLSLSASSCDPITVAPSIVNDDCSSSNVGAIDLNASGIAPLTFLWSTGAMTEDISGLSAGTYTVVVTDGDGCSESYSYTISEVGNLDLVLDVVYDPCAPEAVITAVTSASVFSWDNGATTQAITVTSPGSYCVTVSQGGCTATECVVINGLSSGVTTSTDVVVACDTYTWIDGNVYMSSNNTATHTLVNAAGCDSIVTLDLTINNSSSSTSTITACDSYTWNGTSYSTSGTYIWMGTNAEGCDSTATLNLTINSTSSSVNVITACDTYLWNGTTYNTSGTYMWTGMNAAGCDSTATLNLTINNSSSSTATATACDTYLWNGITYSASGTYTWLGVNAAGCDSTATLNLTVNNSSTSTTSHVACNAYVWNGTTYTTSGTYTWTGTNAAGCDSTAILSLVINEDPSVVIVNQEDDICGSCSGVLDADIVNGVGGVYELTPNSQTNSTGYFDNLCAGSYVLTTTSSEGCISTMNIQIAASTDTLVLDSLVTGTCKDACTGGIDLTISGGTLPYTYSWSNGSSMEDLDGLCPGTYSVVVTDANGCQLTQVFNVPIVNPVANFTYSEGANCVVNFFDLSSTNYGNLSWTWTFGDGGTSTLQNPSHPYQGPGNYFVCLNVVAEGDTFYCESRYCEQITVKCDSVNGIQDINDFEEIEVVPNPTDGLITIKGDFNQGEDVVLRIFAPDGKLVKEELFRVEDEIVVDLSEESSGVYFVWVKQENNYYRAKIIKN